MNNYLGRDEKNNLVRLMILKVQLEKVLETYSSLKNIDKSFLADLRHSKTRLHKATEVRLGYLDDEAKKNLMLSIAKLNITFMPTPEAKKARQEMLELQSTFPMAADDFNTWYEFVIESTCKMCTRVDYEECPARRILTKYEVFPVDPGVQGRCQYNYGQAVVPNIEFDQKESLLIDDLWKQIAGLKEQLSESNRLKIKISEILHPDGDGPTNPSMCDIVAYVRDMDSQCDSLSALNKELQVKSDKYNELMDLGKRPCIKDKEDLDDDEIHEDDLVPVFLGLNNGNKLEIFLPETMAKNLIDEIQRPRISRSICARYVDGEFVAIDLQEVVAMRVSGLVDVEPVKPQTSAPVHAFVNEQERYWIECRCGAEYLCNMNAGRPVARCRECSEKLFADRSVDTISDKSDGSEATLLTNRYFVSRELQPPVRDI